MMRRLDIQIQIGIFAEKSVIKGSKHSDIQTVCTADSQQQGLLIPLQFHGFFPERHPPLCNGDKFCAFGCQFYLLMPFISDHKRETELVFKRGETMADSGLGQKEKDLLSG